MLYWITPSLALADSYHDDIVDVHEALVQILTGEDAIVGSLDEVYEVLTSLDLSDDEITSKVNFAFGLK